MAMHFHLRSQSSLSSPKKQVVCQVVILVTITVLHLFAMLVMSVCDAFRANVMLELRNH